jgi:hypothetical protein
MIISAKFIGTNSLGFENGKRYSLKIANRKGISIQRLIDGAGKCTYESLSAFLKNWTNINHPELSANIPADWTKPVDDILTVPDPLEPLFNKIGMQINFLTISGKNKTLTVADITEISRRFFSSNQDALQLNPKTNQT